MPRLLACFVVLLAAWRVVSSCIIFSLRSGLSAYTVWACWRRLSRQENSFAQWHWKRRSPVCFVIEEVKREQEVSRVGRKWKLYNRGERCVARQRRNAPTMLRRPPLDLTAATCHYRAYALRRSQIDPLPISTGSLKSLQSRQPWRLSHPRQLACERLDCYIAPNDYR